MASSPAQGPQSPFYVRYARKIAIGVVGGAVTLVGLALLILPGPGILVIMLGLAILSLEFSWAGLVRVWLHGRFDEGVARARARRDGRRTRPRRDGRRTRVDAG